MNSFVELLENSFIEQANEQIAVQQKAYMKGQFEYFGLKSPLRREVSKPFLQKEYLPPKSDLKDLVIALWKKPQRDFHYVGMELCFKYKRQFEKEDLELFEYMALNNSWWDTIDYIAPKLIGGLFLKYPELRDPFVKKWLPSGNIWLQRSCILFQLKYKEKMDVEFLEHIINSLLGSKEFFINKAIGWILRERSKTDPAWVIEMLNKTDLSNLSRREASKYL